MLYLICAPFSLWQNVAIAWPKFEVLDDFFVQYVLRRPDNIGQEFSPSQLFSCKVWAFNYYMNFQVNLCCSRHLLVTGLSLINLRFNVITI